MSTWPDPAEDSGGEQAPEPRLEEASSAPAEMGEPAEEAESRLAAPGAPESESYLGTYAQVTPPVRFPNIADVLVMAILLGLGWLASAGVTAEALHLHLFGVTSERQAMNDIHYTLGSQGVWYLITIGLWMLVFPHVWNTGFFSGIEWRAAEALRLRRRLLGAAFACFVLAMVDGLVLPGPKEAPIDQVFRLPGAAWLLFVFGITLAPFMEEAIYRGFLLPALCTAWDWSVERALDRPAPWPDEHGRTRWSRPAMVAATVLVSIPFALMHGYQTSYSFGTFILLFFVSSALCWVRLSTRSVAASTVVHACYNFLLFALMIWGTGGFKHLDKM